MILTSSPVNLRVLKEKQNVTNKRKEKPKNKFKKLKVAKQNKSRNDWSEDYSCLFCLEKYPVWAYSSASGRVHGSCPNCEQNDVARHVEAVSQAQESFLRLLLMTM